MVFYDMTTIKAVIEKIVARFSIKLEFILAVPGRRYGDFVELLEPFRTEQCLTAKEEILGETVWNKLMDGKLLLVTNAPDFTPEEVVKRGRSRNRPFPPS